MLQINKVMLSGNLTRDPDVSTTQGGTSICDFGLAANRRFQSGGQEKSETCFVTVTAFGKLADICGKYLSKGSAAYVEGRLCFEEWQDKSGARRTTLKVIADQVQFLSSPRGGNSENRSENGYRNGGERRSGGNGKHVRNGVSEEYAPPVREERGENEELPPF